MKLQKTMLRGAIIANFIGLTLLSAASTVQAADSASIIEARQDKLKKMGGAMKAINEQLKSDKADMAKIQQAAKTLAVNASALPEWFPAGSGAESGIETDALAAIWQDPAKFSASAKALINETSVLAKLANQNTTDGLASQLKAVKDSCSNCHKSFRAD